MALVSSLGAFRMNALRLSQSRLNPQMVNHRHVRQFSSIIMIRGPTLKNNVLRGTLATRTYWWSSSKPIETSPPPTPLQILSDMTATPEISSVGGATVESVSSFSTPATVEPSVPAASQLPPIDAPIPPMISEAPSSLTVPDFLVPLQYGDFASMGLTGWSPAGIFRSLLETVNVFTGMSWFWTIITVTLLSRIVILPFAIMALRDTTRLQPYNKELVGVGKELQHAKAVGDKQGVYMAALKQKAIYQKASVSIPRMLLSPIMQVPVSLGMFFAVKTVCQYPVAQLQNSGFSLMPDLTVADPTYILPLMFVGIVQVQIKLGLKDADYETRTETGHLMNGLRVISLVSVPFLAGLPCGVFLTMFTGMAAITVQSQLFRLPAIRRMLGVGPALQHTKPPPTIIDTFNYMRSWWRNASRRAADNQMTRERRSMQTVVKENVKAKIRR